MAAAALGPAGPWRIRTVLPTARGMAILPCRFAWALPGPLAWSRGLFGAGCGVRMRHLPGVGPRRVCPRGGRRVGSEYTRNILGIYYVLAVSYASVQGAVGGGGPTSCPHAGTSALASELRLGAGVSLAQGLP